VERLNRVLAFVIFIFSVEIEQMKAQCNPAPGETCADAGFFCSLDEMNGYTCKNSSTTEGNCQPRCAPCVFPWCPPYPLRTWYSFLSQQGGNVSITLNVGTCNCMDTCQWGMVLGIWGDCNCNQQLMCIPGCTYQNTSVTYNVNLQPCKIYYLSLDECCDCVCDFTINTSTGGGPPSLTLGDINNNPSGIIEPVCKGFCGYHFSVQAQSSCLTPGYLWTLDGQDLGENKKDIYLDFPEAGDFNLCVTAYLGNPESNCKVTKCATVKVKQLPDRFGKSRSICYETANSGGYQWHSQIITSPGTYREQLKDNNCCIYDSVVQFTVLPVVNTNEVLFVSCDNRPYVDPSGFSYPLCTDKLFITLPKSTEKYECDSSIILTSVNIILSPDWHAQCLGSKVEISPNISITDTCSVKTTQKLNYNWYRKADTTKAAISNTAILLTDTIDEEYCLDVGVKVFLASDSAFCVKTICEDIDESKSGVINTNTAFNYCDSAVVKGITYKQSTTLTENIKTAFGCDSIISMQINIYNSSKTDLDLKGCDSVAINGQTYFQSGDYTQQLSSTNGCDSVINIHAEIYKTKFSALFNSACDSVSINGQTYTQTGQYTQLLKTTVGCDSILRIDVDVFKSSNEDLTYNACDSIDINGKVYKQSGKYIQKLFSRRGCDSVLNLDLTIQPSSQTDITKTSCDSVIFNGKVYKQSGDYTERYTSSNGCDSLIVLHVNIPNSNTSPLILSSCDTVTINGILYNQSGNYSQKLISANGCDSILNIELVIWESGKAEIGRQECDSAVINNITYYQSGIYQQKLQTHAGCDSTLNIDLKITGSSSRDTIFRSCDSIIINGVTYTQTGIYQQTLTNTNLCDSILIIDFTRLSKTSTALSLLGCDSVTVNNQVYKQSGNYTQTFVNANQCDSILNLKVEINNSNSGTLSLSTCDSARINGEPYTQSGNYIQTLTNAEQCDSLLNINLIINKSISVDYPLRACDSVDINGQIYKQSGNYTQYLKTVNLCDSIVNLEIEIRRSGEAEIGKEACDSIIINNISYIQSGIYKQLLQSTNGCDSTLTLDLTIKPGNPSILDAGADTSICEGQILKLNGIFNGPASFKWQGASGNFDFPDRLSTNYYSNSIGIERIYLQAADDCKQWLDSLNLQILPNQFVRVTGDTIIDPCKDKEIRFTATGGNNYTWTPSSNIECLDPPCSHVLLKSNLASRFTITTDGPCAFPSNLNVSLSQTQSDVYLPNAFSPNGDNINDIFLPKFNCDAVTFYNLQIFDRWGNLMFESSNKEMGWNGKHENEYLNPGVYPYVLQFELHGSGRKVKSGDVTIIR
jgi:gliding motility-associated-like protein